MALKYLSAFFAILLLGNIADVPIMFLGVRGELSLYFVFIAGFCTDIFSDFFWYWMGSKMGLERLEKIWFFRGKASRIEATGRVFDKYGMLILFISKFVTTIGIPAQVVAGAHKYPIKKMLFANVLGALALLGVVFSLARVFASDVVAEHFLKNADLGLLAFLAFIMLLHYLISKPIDKLLTKNREKNDSSSNGNI